jgi:hypothetical protein
MNLVHKHFINKYLNYYSSLIDIKSWVDQQIKNNTRIAIPIMTHPGIEMT